MTARRTIQSMDELLSLVPAQYAPYVQAVVAVIAVCSVIGASVKPLLGLPSANDPAWKRVAFAVLSVVDWLAANSETVKSKRQRSKSVEVVEEKQNG